jgi:glycosyltransferase involved in cell wall biosynthesis
MRRIGLRELARGGEREGRVLLYSIWFADHNNPRYAELLPRLSRLDACLVQLPANRVARRAGYQAFHALRRTSHRTLLRRAARRYRSLLALDFDQLGDWPADAVMDADDPFFTESEVQALNSPSVRAYVVTAERAAHRYEALGVAKPFVVVPQGVSLTAATPELRASAAGRKQPGELVVGWMAAHLLTAGDRDGDNALYNVDHLLELWEQIHAEAPSARLWLVGGASDRLRERLQSRDDIRLFGRLPRAEALATAAAFDVAVYARTEDQGIQAAKVAELMGLGVPTVSYDYEVTANIKEAGAGVLVAEPREFVAAAVRVLHDEPARRELAAAAARAGAQLDWDVLARRYETDVLDRFLPG